MTLILETPSVFLDGLTDAGTWSAHGVTHWHCHMEEQPITVNGRPNEARFNTERVRDIVNREFVTSVSTPREALVWLIEQWTSAVNDPRRCPDPSAVLKQRLWHTDELWHHQVISSWATLTTSRATPAGCGVQLRPNQSLDAFCYPMTTARCRRHS